MNDYKILQKKDSDFQKILSKALDILLQFINRLTFYDFKLKMPLDSGFFKDDDMLNLLIFSDDWEIILKYLVIFDKLINYNSWKLDNFDFYKQKKILMVAYSFLCKNHSNRETFFSLIDDHPFFQQYHSKDLKKTAELSEYTIKFYQIPNKQTIKLNFKEIIPENDKENTFDYAMKIAKKYDIKESSLEFFELLFEIKIRRFSTEENRFCFVLIGVLFGNMLYDLDFNQFI